MKKTRRGARLIVIPTLLATVLLTTAGCNKLMDTSPDSPHRPVISNLVMEPVTVARGATVSFTFDYFDAGEDIVTVHVRDNQSGRRWIGVPPPDSPEDYVLFPETSGRATFFIEELDVSQAGPHTFEFWLEDEKESFSEHVTFTIYVVI